MSVKPGGTDVPEHRVVFRRKGEVGEHRFKKTKVGGAMEESIRTS